ncbi:MAG: hypothetical protein MCSN_3920 [Candidatus Microsyncoccus archaeolyticus]|nr:MAG: hypothetical protein MCSN_3920 [Candidatus Parcubacteria bacterium]
MQNNVLSEEQKQLLPLLKDFSKQFGLIGGTAIALQIGHRRSIDFDLASIDIFDNSKIKNKIERIDSVVVDEKGEYTIVTKNTKITFLYYPFKIEFNNDFEGIRVADLLTLSALKAYALGRRTKWKDYVDLYFILKNYTLDQVVEKAESIFGNEFNEKIFRAQLGYFEDIDYSEEVEYMPGFEVTEDVIKKELLKISLEK